MKRGLLIIAFYVTTFSLFAQKEKEFVKHLLKNNLKSEHFTLLQLKSKLPFDSLNYLWSQYYLNYNENQNLIKSIQQSSFFLEKDTAFFNACSVYFLSQKPSGLDGFYSIAQNLNRPYYSSQIYSLVKLINEPAARDTFLIPIKLKTSFNNFFVSCKKKPAIAAGLSAVLPGAGKLYTGRPRSFVNVLFAHVLNGIALYETINKRGIKNPYSIFCVSYTGLFYLANVYGSYHDVKQARMEKRKKFLFDAKNYYNINCHYPPE